MTALARVLAELDTLADDDLERAIGHAFSEQQRRHVAELVVPAGPPSPSGLLDTKAAGVYLGGRSADFIRRQVRIGRLSVVRNDGTRSRMGFELAELDRWKAVHGSSVAAALAGSYSPPDDKRRAPHGAPRARVDAKTTRPRARGDAQHGRPVGARRARRARPGGAEPFTPSASAWRLPVPGPPPDPEG
jgi:hypothetical protein